MAEYTIPSHTTAPTKCPNCSGQLVWSAPDGQLKCTSCDTMVAAPPSAEDVRIAEHDLMNELSRPRPKGALGAGGKQMKCSECGAVVEFPDNITAKRCEFCDSPSVLAEAARTDHYLPESVVPFAVGRDQATKAFRTWLAKLWFRPSNLKHKADLAELHGVYIPYWTFDADVTSDWSADAGYYYYETEHYTTVENGKSVSKTRQVRKVRWVPCSGRRHDKHDDHLVCASKGLPYAMARGMANFDTAALTPYSAPLMQGFSAESYAVELPEAWTQGQKEIADIQESRCSRDVPGDTQRGLRVSNRFASCSFKHVLLPVWIAAYRYHEKVFRFLVNGQTGRVSGNAPWSWLKISLAVIAAIALAVALFVLFQKK